MPDERAIHIPDAMKAVRYAAPRTLNVSGELPLIDPKGPKSKQLQKRLIAHTKVFDLNDATQCEAYEAVWQEIADGKAQFCEKTGPNWDEAKGRFVVCLRWATPEFKLPQS